MNKNPNKKITNPIYYELLRLNLIKKKNLLHSKKLNSLKLNLI
jgi:hypothetical protein